MPHSFIYSGKPGMAVGNHSSLHPFSLSHTKHTPYCSLEISYLKMTLAFSPETFFCFLLSYCPYLTHAFYCPPPYSLCTKTHTESASSSWSLPPPLYHFTLSPSLPPDFSHVRMGAQAHGTAGAAFALSDACVRLCFLLINTGTRNHRAHMSHFLTHTHLGV